MQRVERPNLRTVLACALMLGAGAGTAIAQANPNEANPSMPPTDPDDLDTPAPDDTSPPVTTYPSPPPITPPVGTADTEADTEGDTTTVVAPPPPPVVEKPVVERTDIDVYVVEPQDTWTKRNGVALSLGGGVGQFTDASMRDTAGVAGMWDLRGHFGLTFPIGFEVAYLGQAGDINPRLGPASSAVLIGNGVEAVARFNLVTRQVVQPYLFGGAAWKHYSVNNADFSTSATGIQDEDDVIEIPVGVGMSYRGFSGMFADARFTFRGAMREDLVIGTPDDNAANDFLSDEDAYLPMHNWSAGARVGYEF